MSTGKYRSIAQHGAATERVQRVMADGTSLASLVATLGTTMEVTELSNDAKKCEGCLALVALSPRGQGAITKEGISVCTTVLTHASHSRCTAYITCRQAVIYHHGHVVVARAIVSSDSAACRWRSRCLRDSSRNRWYCIFDAKRSYSSIITLNLKLVTLAMKREENTHFSTSEQEVREWRRLEVSQQIFSRD